MSAIVAISAGAPGSSTLFTSLRGPRRRCSHFEDSLETQQASYEIQPRVFYEDFKDYVLYVQEVKAGTGVANWRNVFLADLSAPALAAHHQRRPSDRRQ